MTQRRGEQPNDQDRRLLDLLAEADAQLAPPPTAGFTSERLTALAARRARRRAAAAVSVVLATALATTLWSLRWTVTPGSPPAPLPTADLLAQWRTLRDDVARFAERLQADCSAAAQADTMRSLADARRTDSLRLRCELATARADASLAFAWPPVQETPR